MKNVRNKKTLEWLRQADYDMDTALFMFKGKRFFYAVFMCHLSIEKAIKGLYQEKVKEIPPKVHNFVYLLKKIGIKPPEVIGKFIVRLNESSVVTRYPENLDKLQKEYTKLTTENILKGTEEVLVWVKNQF